MAAKANDEEIEEKPVDHLGLAQKEVKKFGYLWKRAKDKDDLDEVLKNVASMCYELRSPHLSPKQYYTLFMDVTNQLHGLDSYFQSLNKSGVPMEEIYRRVQETSKVLPRLYLLSIAGAVYIQSKEAAAKHILKDLVEMAKGVQHPMRALFLRNFMNQQTRKYLPDIDNEFSGEGGTVYDSIDFILKNFTEMNKLWVRMQNVGGRRRRGRPLTERQKKDRAEKKKLREAQRRDLKILVGLNLQRLGSLEGVDVEVYGAKVLPGILEQIANCRDVIAQEYLMDLIVHGFPCEYHLETLNQYLETCAELKEGVNIGKILQTFMDRLATYAASNTIPEDLNIFKRFDVKVHAVIRATEMKMADILDLKHSQLGFALRCAPTRAEQLVHAGHILGFVASSLSEMTTSGSRVSEGAESDIGVKILTTCIEALRADVLNPKVGQFGNVLKVLPWKCRKSVAFSLLQSIVDDEKTVINTPELTKTVLRYAMPLVTDEDDAPGDYYSKMGNEFVREQLLMAKMIQRIECDNPAVQFKVYQIARSQFGHGGTNRIKYTLLPLVFGALRLVNRALENPTCGVKLKKVFQFVHETVTALASNHANVSLRLFLQTALAADRLAGNEGAKGFTSIAYEFVVQSLILFEEMANSKQKFAAINEIIGTLYQCVNFTSDEYENLVTKVTQYAAKLIKKPDQCRMVALCCHLFWTADKSLKKEYEDPARVLVCLQRCLKIADKVMGDHTQYFVEILNAYIHFYQNACPSIKKNYLQGLVKLIKANASDEDGDDALGGGKSADEKKATEAFFKNTLRHIRNMQEDAELGEAFKGLTV